MDWFIGHPIKSSASVTSLVVSQGCAWYEIFGHGTGDTDVFPFEWIANGWFSDVP